LPDDKVAIGVEVAGDLALVPDHHVGVAAASYDLGPVKLPLKSLPMSKLS
jgi:hypothetical protein